MDPANLLTKWHWIVELARKKKSLTSEGAGRSRGPVQPLRGINRTGQRRDKHRYAGGIGDCTGGRAGRIAAAAAAAPSPPMNEAVLIV
jgi:hypothetical protein